MRRGRVSTLPGAVSWKVTGVYSFDGINRIIASDVVEAETDAKAIVAAKQVASGVSFEVWDGHRLVARMGHNRNGPETFRRTASCVNAAKVGQ